MLRPIPFAWCVFAAMLCATRPSAADETEEELVDPRSPIPIALPPGSGSYHVSDVIITTGAGVTILVATLIGPASNPMRGGILVDEDVRSALRLDHEDSRRMARDASDALLNIMLAFPFVVDVAAYTAWYRKSPTLAWNIGLVDLETLALTEAVRTVVNVGASRERPYGRDCGGALPNDARDCDSRSRYYSFFSGHTSQTFASAALTCSHHLNIGLYGGGWADATPCIAGFGLAAATATLRMVGDMHYLSDVLVGAAFGTAMGFVVPWLVLYRKRGHAAEHAASDGLRLVLVPVSGGAGIAGAF